MGDLRLQEAREGREYLEYDGEPDDDEYDGNGSGAAESFDEADYEAMFRRSGGGAGRISSQYEDDDYDDADGDAEDADYSGAEGDEDMDAYRDRIFGDLQREIDERKKRMGL